MSNDQLATLIVVIIYGVFISCLSIAVIKYLLKRRSENNRTTSNTNTRNNGTRYYGNSGSNGVEMGLYPMQSSAYVYLSGACDYGTGSGGHTGGHSGGHDFGGSSGGGGDCGGCCDSGGGGDGGGGGCY